MEKVLVLMATYNGEKYLQEQLCSLYNQKNVSVSVLVRDDGSSDSTIDILKENEKNHELKWYQGIHSNVQKGFFELMVRAKELPFKYIAFCDQDDVWDDDKLDIAIQQIKQYDVPALYYAGQRLVDENLKLIEIHKLNSQRSLKTRFVLSDFAGCTGVFNRELLEQVVGFEPDYMLMHDTWILRVCLAIGGEVIVDCAPRMNYRQHSGNTLGLGHSIGATIKQVRQYIFDYKIEKLTLELLRGYAPKMVPEYRQLAEWICTYKTDKAARDSLLNKDVIDFYNKGLNFTYWLKIKMNRL